ncbi:hypothetical protein X975_15727, partial [Stegodyphus mimosarum]
MKFAKVFLLQIAACFLCLCSVCGYDYNEIRKWNASCSPKDTCSVPRDLDNSDHHNCDCSSLCVLYDTCCLDSPFLNISSKYERSASCRSAGLSEKSVFMIDVCSSSYKGPVAIRRRCEQNAKNWSDPFNNVPVTNPSSFKTYKSLFCAICNGENPKELTMWQVVMDCSSLNEYMKVCNENRDFVLNNMMYIREKGLWGLWSWDSKTDWKFRYLHMSYEIPHSLKNVIKECRPNLISDCAPNWRDQKTKKLCNRYMGAIYFPNAAYRNVHCAVCNYQTSMANMSCHDTFIPAFKSPTLSFGILLDINLKDGDKVGTVEKKCEVNQVYDPFSKKCRTLECPLPGFTLKNGKCVQE